MARCVRPFSRSSTIWMRWRCASGIFQRSAAFISRTWRLLHLTIRSPRIRKQIATANRIAPPKIRHQITENCAIQSALEAVLDQDLPRGHLLGCDELARHPTVIWVTIRSESTRIAIAVIQEPITRATIRCALLVSRNDTSATIVSETAA